MSHEPTKPNPEAEAAKDETVEPVEAEAAAPATGEIMGATANGTGTIRVTN